MINRRVAKSLYPASFTKNEMEISNPTDIANKFCDYFTNIEPNLARKIPSTNSSPKDFLSSALSESISLQPLTVGELNNIVKSFNANKAPGHDNIPMKIIHQSFQDIACADSCNHYKHFVVYWCVSWISQNSQSDSSF